MQFYYEFNRFFNRRCFFAIVACLVAATTMRDYLGTDEEREKGNQFSRNKLALIFNDICLLVENSLERIVMGFSLRRTAKSLFKKETGPNDITCIHGMKSILALFIYVAHRNMIMSITPYLNRMYYAHVRTNIVHDLPVDMLIYIETLLVEENTLSFSNSLHPLFWKN